jgi:hypothetical protein
MPSINDRKSIGHEVVLRVRSSGSGVKVVELDGTGLAPGIMTKRNRVYKYGDDAEQKATESAYRLADKIRDARNVPVTVVELGEVVAEEVNGLDADREAES